ncbi:MAG TPA: ABC transporter ATP-binding protein [Gemmatimonadaceae bacterium]|nr:ABC transporter ATP-binding protein [Gemmatimonadaceae bacterium]
MQTQDLRRALRYVAPYWRPLLLVLGLSLLGTVLSLYLPLLSRSLIDVALLGRDPDALLRIVAAFFGLTLASFALNVVSGLQYTRVSANILFDMRLALFRHLQRLSPRFYARTPLGQIASRINSDIGEIQRVAAEIALAWVGNVVFLVGTVAILLSLDPVLFAVSIALLPLSLWALVKFRSRLERAVADMRDRSAGIGSFLIETLLGMKLVVSLNAQEREIGRFRQHNDAFVESLMRMRRLTYLSGGIPGLLLSLGSAAVFLVGGYRVINGAITMGTLVAFVAYQMRLLGPIQGMMGLYSSLATARVSLRRVHEILDTPPEVVESAAAVALDMAVGAVEFDDVTFAFDRGAPVLDRVRISVRAGERVALVGRSGEGKSTIADLLVRQLDPDSGRITLDGHDVKSLRLADLRRHMVVVDQEPFVFNATIGENIRYARPDAPDADVLEAARAAGLGDLLARMPDGITTSVGERGRALSAGERQRLAIARAFLANPAVLVLDEATGALDPATEAQVVSGYEAVMRGRTTIVITHRLELARRAERIVVLDRGRIVEEGSAETLLQRGEAFVTLFGAQQPTA